MNRTRTLLIVLLAFWGSASAQNYQGVWQGVITGKDLLNDVDYTLNVRTHQGDIITGKVYMYHNFLYVFYGIFDFIGTVEKGGCRITELKIVNSELPDTYHYLCIKYGHLNYSFNDTAQYLTGKWDNTKGYCAPGEIYLKRIVAGKAGNIQVPGAVLARMSADASESMSFLETTLSSPVILTVRSNTLKLSISDYLREDNDTVSVYLNRELVIKDLRIRKKVFTKTLRLDKLSSLNEIVMYANNLGRIPPNTCLLTVDDGRRKQVVSIQSTKEKSASVYPKYELP